MILQILFDQIQGYSQGSINSSFHSKFFVCLQKNEQFFHKLVLMKKSNEI